MKKLDNVFSPNRRIIILQFLQGDNDYSLNNGMLQKVLIEFGHGVSLEDTNKEITWLEEKGLVTVETLSKTMTLVKLTRKGLDVAEGHARIDGVERPAPEY